MCIQLKYTKMKFTNSMKNILGSFLTTVFAYLVYAFVIDIKTAEMFSPVIFLLVLIYLEISDKK